MRKALGLSVILAALVAAICVWQQTQEGRIAFLSSYNLRNQLTWVGLFGILSLGQALVIITGGIDLSVGSVVALVGITCAMILDAGAGVFIAVPVALLVATGIGALNGTLITKLRIQPFVVTLCGLFVVRGVSRLLTGDASEGFGLGHEKLLWFGSGAVGIIPVPFIILLLFSAVVAAFLHFSPVGRHLFALGANEEAARFSGIRTGQLTLAAYMLCGLLTGIAGLLFAFKVQSMTPSDFGSFYELYAIAGAVLGGCSLRGGTGNVLAVIIAVTLIVVIKNMVNLLAIASQWEYIVIGSVILSGVVIDELFTRRQARVAAGAH